VRVHGGIHHDDPMFRDYPRLIPDVRYGPNREPLDWNVCWPHRAFEHFLRASIGTGPNARPVELDPRPRGQGGHGPHVRIIGPEESGKSALLHTVLARLADRHSPDRVQFLVADIDGAAGAFRTVPHLAGDAIGVRQRQFHLRDLYRMLDDELWRRERLTDAELAVEPILVIALDDVDWHMWQYPHVWMVLKHLAPQGEQLRMHLLLTAREKTGPLDDELFTQVTLMDGKSKLDGQSFRPATITPEQLGAFANRFSCYRHPVRDLSRPPAGLTYLRMMQREFHRGPGTPIGVLADGSARIQRLDFTARSHLFIRGERGSGKSAALRTVLRGLSSYPDRLSDAVVLGPAQIHAAAARIREVLEGRLANTSWQGAELFLVADDYDTATDETDPLAPLADLLRHGASVGAHVIVATTEWLRDGPLIDALPEDDCMNIVMMGAEQRRGGHYETVVSRFGHPGMPRLDFEPLGRAVCSESEFGHVQIAWDSGEIAHPLDFLPVEALVVPEPDPDARTALIGATEIGGRVVLDVRGHTWIQGSAGSGKSALLNRIAFSLASRYTLDEVRLVVAGFDGEPLRETSFLPHTLHYGVAWEGNGIRLINDRLENEVERRRRSEEQGTLGDEPRLVVLLDRPGDFITAEPAFGDTLRRLAAVAERLRISLVTAERSLEDGVLRELHRASRNRLILSEASPEAVAAVLGGEDTRATLWAADGGGQIRVGDTAPRGFWPNRMTAREAEEARFALLASEAPPAVFTYDELLRRIDWPTGPDWIPLGVLENGSPIRHGFETDPHFFITGDPGTGRSTVLRTLLRGIARCYSAADARVVLLHDDATKGILPPEYVLAASAGLNARPDIMEKALSPFRKRIGHAAWTGPRLFIVIDDYDLLENGPEPLEVLRELLPHSRQIKLSLLLTGDRHLHHRPEVKRLSGSWLAMDNLPQASSDGEPPGPPAVARGTLMPSRTPLVMPWTATP
jgi:hypothetical protein